MDSLSSFIKEKKNRIYGISILLVSLLVGVLLNRGYSPQKYIDYVQTEENGFVKTKKFGDTKFIVNYLPPAYLTLKDDRTISKKMYTELNKEYGKSTNYILRLESVNLNGMVKGLISNMEEYQTLINYLSFDIKHDLKILIKDKEYPCNFSHFERNYDVAPIAQVNFGFSMTKEMRMDMEEAGFWKIKFDAASFGVGPLYFKFEKDKLETNPTIKF